MNIQAQEHFPKMRMMQGCLKIHLTNKKKKGNKFLLREIQPALHHPYITNIHVIEKQQCRDDVMLAVSPSKETCFHSFLFVMYIFKQPYSFLEMFLYL